MEALHFYSQYVSTPMRLRWSEISYGVDEQVQIPNSRKEKR